MQAAQRIVHAVVERFNGWLGSYTGFVLAVAVSLAWNAAVIVGLDKNGFLYLYLATELGIITQFNLAIIGRHSSRKVDEALTTIDRVVDESYAAAQALLQLGANQAGIQEALAAQADVIVAQTKVIAEAVGAHSEELDMLVELAQRTEEIAARTDANERQQTVLLESRSEILDRLDSTVAELARGLAEDADRRRKLAMRISDIGQEPDPPRDDDTR